jgi:enamine deaminase RidA (YjgF/YER057c/UK114 family)
MSNLEYPRAVGVAPGNGYSHVVTGHGQWVAIAGQVALDPDGKLVGVGDPGAQAEQVFANLERCLAGAGATFEDIA